MPYAVVGSMEEVKVGNKMVKARQYPWGTVQGNLHAFVSLLFICLDDIRKGIHHET